MTAAAVDTEATSPARRLHPLVPVLAILAVALVVRVGLVLATRDMPLVDDPIDYNRLGQSLADGRGFGDTALAAGGGPTAFRPPLYPLFLGAVYAVTGDSITAARLAQAVLGVLAVGLLGVIAWQLWGRRTALVVLGVAAVYPPFVLVGNPLLTEALSLPLQLGAFAAVLEHRRTSEHRWRWALIGGALAGLAALTRNANAVMLLPLALLLVRPGEWRRTRAWAAPAALVAAALVVMVPWAVRNQRAFDRAIPFGTSDAFIFAGVYNAQAHHDPDRPAAWRPPVFVPELAPLFDDRSLDEGELARELRSRSTSYLGDHPGYLAKVVFWNSARLFDLAGLDETHESAASLGYGTRAANVWLAGYALVVVLALGGALSAAAAARRAPNAFWLTPLLLVAVTVPTLGTSRYRVPIEPFLLLLAALAIVRVADRARSGGGAT